MSADAIMWDLDSTLAHTWQRRHLVPPHEKIKPFQHPHELWHDYAMACGDDSPIQGSITVMRMSHSLGWSNHIVSGRSDSAYDLTSRWLKANDVPYDTLRLHKPSDIHHNGHYKVREGIRLMEEGYNLKLVVEDWPDVASLLEQELGVPVLVVNPCYPSKDETAKFNRDNPDSVLLAELRGLKKELASDDGGVNEGYSYMLHRLNGILGE